MKWNQPSVMIHKFRISNRISKTCIDILLQIKTDPNGKRSVGIGLPGLLFFKVDSPVLGWWKNCILMKKSRKIILRSKPAVKSNLLDRFIRVEYEMKKKWGRLVLTGWWLIFVIPYPIGHFCWRTERQRKKSESFSDTVYPFHSRKAICGTADDYVWLR